MWSIDTYKTNGLRPSSSPKRDKQIFRWHLRVNEHPILANGQPLDILLCLYSYAFTIFASRFADIVLSDEVIYQYGPVRTMCIPDDYLEYDKEAFEQEQTAMFVSLATQYEAGILGTPLSDEVMHQREMFYENILEQQLDIIYRMFFVNDLRINENVLHGILKTFFDFKFVEVTGMEYRDITGSLVLYINS